MSNKRRQFSSEFKVKLVLEVLKNEKPLSQIAQENKITPKHLINWKKQFLENAEIAMEPSKVVKEYKDQIKELEKKVDKYAKTVGKLTVERDWAVGCSVSGIPQRSEDKASLDLIVRKEMIDKSEGVQAKSKNPSLNRQLQLLHMSKTAHYYTPVTPFSSKEDKELLDMIDKIHTKHPYYGTRRTVALLKRLGFDVGRKLVKSAFAFMGIKALYPKPKTTIANKEHKKYPYLLDVFKNEEEQVVINKKNQVWSGDITYIKLENGFAYLAAIIDWHTKKILSWKLSNTMDVHLTTSVLKEAIALHGKPEIFNSDQGSQYTAKEHIEILEQNSISISMDAKGRSIDNIVIERFWRTLKYEDVYPKAYNTIKEAREGIREYIQVYNKERLHSSLDYKTPDEIYYRGINNKSYDTKKMLLEVA